MATSNTGSKSGTSAAGSWWVALIAGVALAIVGLLMLLAPAMTILTITQFLGFYWLIDGVVRILSIFVDHTGWGWKLAIGVLSIIVGLVAIQHPLWSGVLIPTTLVFVVGFGGLFIGVLEIISAFLGGGWGTGILGVVSLIFGLLLLLNPLAGAVALTFAFGVLALVGGIGTALGSLFLRSAERQA